MKQELTAYEYKTDMAEERIHVSLQRAGTEKADKTLSEKRNGMHRHLRAQTDWENCVDS